MKAVLVLLLSLFVTGCANTPPAIHVQVPVSCLGETPQKPIYRFAKLPKPITEADSKAAAVVLFQDFESAESYGTKWEAASIGCRSLPVASPAP